MRAVLLASCIFILFYAQSQALGKISLAVNRVQVYADGEAPFYEPFQETKTRVSKSQMAQLTTLTAGNPPEDFTVAIDTWISVTAVPLGNCSCNKCSSPSCAKTGKSLQGATPIGCSSETCSAKVCSPLQPSDCYFEFKTVESATVHGSLLAPAPVSLGGASFEAVIGGISSQNQVWNNRAEGVLSLAYANEGFISSPNAVPNFSDAFMKSLNISNVITLSFSNSTGRITFGGEDDNIKTNVSYVPIISNSLYGVRLNSISFGEGIEIEDVAYIQSSSSKNWVKSDTFNKIERFFKDNYQDLPGIGSEPSIFKGRCLELNEVERYPNLTYTFSGVAITVGALTYFQAITIQEFTLYCFAFDEFDSDDDSRFIGLGDPFLRAVSVVLDREQKRVGFATTPSTSSTEIVEFPEAEDDFDVNLRKGTIAASVVFAVCTVIFIIMIILAIMDPAKTADSKRNSSKYTPHMVF